MRPNTVDGWLTLPCDAPDYAQVFITAHEQRWPAYRDYDALGNRVAKIRDPGPSYTKGTLEVDGRARNWRR